MPSPDEILLGTVGLEPNRWGGLDGLPGASIRLTDWLPAIADAGFDGMEVWDRHLTSADEREVEAVLDGPVPVAVFNSYTSLDEPDPADRTAVAGWVGRTGSSGVKFNVGNDPSKEAAYSERIAAWVEAMPDGVALLCECHEGTSVAEDHAVAARILGRAGPPDRVQAIVHTHESADHVRSRFDAYGDRITHVHVNFLDRGAPPLADARADLEASVSTLRDLGFVGTWTLEFVHGVLTDRDEPAHLVAQAAADLRVLRDVVR